MSKKGVKIPLKEIEVNKENFRHSPLNSELDAIHYLISEDYDNYFNLARTMAKDCRTFTILILERNNKKILMDANRRVSVLKIFDNPKLIPLDSKFDNLRQLCIARGSLNIYELNADIYYDHIIEDKENLMEALDDLHVNDNKTKKDWNALSQYRASKFIGSSIKHPWIKTLEYYHFTDDDIINMTYKRTDIFNRILRKNQLKILDNGKINLPNDVTLIKQICKIVKERAYYIDDKIQKVDTRTKPAIYQEIVDDLIQKYSIGQTSISFVDGGAVETNQYLINTESPNTESTKFEQTQFDIDKIDTNNNANDKPLDTQNVSNLSPLSTNKQRTTIISSEQKNELSSTGNPTIDRVALELSLLKISNIHVNEIDGFLISGTLLLRTFLQYSFEWYCNQNSIPLSAGLEDTIKKASDYMFNQKKITKEQKNIVKNLVKKENIINILNDTVHNYNSSINRTLLCDFYDSIHPLIKNIYK